MAKIIETRTWYDPEGCSAPDDEKVFFSGDLQACKKCFADLQAELKAKADKYKEEAQRYRIAPTMYFEMLDEHTIELYYPNAISKKYYILVEI